MVSRSAMLIDLDGSARVVTVPVGRFGDAPALLIDPATQDGSVAAGGWLIALESAPDSPIYRRTRQPLPADLRRQEPRVEGRASAGAPFPASVRA